jgi:hydroxyacylglutathione hydrolase
MIMSWPDDTRLYCLHEYRQANAPFALTVEPDNRALIERASEVDRLLARGVPTVPTTLAAERPEPRFGAALHGRDGY